MARVSLGARPAARTPCRGGPSQGLDTSQTPGTVRRRGFHSRPNQRSSQIMDQVSPVRPSVHRSIPTNPGTSISSLVAKMTNRHQITNRLLKQTVPNTAENTPPSTSSQNSASFLQPPPPTYRKKKKVKLQPLHGRLPQCPQPHAVPPNQSCEVSDGVIHRHGILPPIVVDGIASDCECGSDRTAGELSGYSSANDFHSDFTDSDVTIDFLSASASNESLLDRSVSQQGRPDEGGGTYKHLPDSPYPLCPPNSVSGSLGSDKHSMPKHMNYLDGGIVQQNTNTGSRNRKEVNVCRIVDCKKVVDTKNPEESKVTFSSDSIEPKQSRSDIHWKTNDQPSESVLEPCRPSPTQIENKSHSRFISSTCQTETQIGRTDCDAQLSKKSNQVRQIKGNKSVKFNHAGNRDRVQRKLVVETKTAETHKGNTKLTNKEDKTKVSVKSQLPGNLDTAGNENGSQRGHIKHDTEFPTGNERYRFDSEVNKIDGRLGYISGFSANSRLQQDKPNGQQTDYKTLTATDVISQKDDLHHLQVDIQSGRPLARVSPTRQFGPVPDGNGNLVVTRFSDNQAIYQTGIIPPLFQSDTRQFLDMNSGKPTLIQHPVSSESIAQCLQSMRACHYAIFQPPQEKYIPHDYPSKHTNSKEFVGNEKLKQKDKSILKVSQNSDNKDSPSKCPTEEPMSIQGMRIRHSGFTPVSSKPVVSHKSHNSPSSLCNTKITDKNNTCPKQTFPSEIKQRHDVVTKEKCRPACPKNRQSTVPVISGKRSVAHKTVNSPKRTAPPPWRYTGSMSGIPPLCDAKFSSHTPPKNLGKATWPKERRRPSSDKEPSLAINKTAEKQGSACNSFPNAAGARGKPDCHIKEKQRKVDNSSSNSVLRYKTMSQQSQSSCGDQSREIVVDTLKDAVNMDHTSFPAGVYLESKENTPISSGAINESKVAKESICSLLSQLQTGTDLDTNDSILTRNMVDVTQGTTMAATIKHPCDNQVDLKNERKECDVQSSLDFHEGCDNPLESAPKPSTELPKRLAYQKSPILLSNNLVVAPMTEAPRIHMVQPGSTTAFGQDVPEIRMILPTPLPPDSEDKCV